MLLQVFILNQVDRLPRLLSGFMAAGVTGTTVLDCKGGLQVMGQAANLDDAPPIFGSLRRFINPDYQSGKMIFIVLRDEDIPVVKAAVHKICGDLRLPNTGIFFSVPVMNWEGVSHK